MEIPGYVTKSRAIVTEAVYRDGKGLCVRTVNAECRFQININSNELYLMYYIYYIISFLLMLNCLNDIIKYFFQTPAIAILMVALI